MTPRGGDAAHAAAHKVKVNAAAITAAARLGRRAASNRRRAGAVAIGRVVAAPPLPPSLDGVRRRRRRRSHALPPQSRGPREPRAFLAAAAAAAASGRGTWCALRYGGRCVSPRSTQSTRARPAALCPYLSRLPWRRGARRIAEGACGITSRCHDEDSPMQRGMLLLQPRRRMRGACADLLGARRSTGDERGIAGTAVRINPSRVC